MKILIIEDELPAQRMMEDMLKAMDQSIEVLACLKSVAESVKWFNSHPHPEIVLLDIQLSDGISFDILKQVKVKSMIIFTTAYDEYAIQAFRVNSLDYLLKPIEKSDLEGAFKKYESYSKRFLRNRNEQIDYSEILEAMQQTKQEYRKRFLIQSNESFYHLPVKEIAYFYSMEKITFAVTMERREYPIDFSLESLKEQLNPDDFFKVNRNFIVGMGSIKKVNSYFSGKLTLELQPAHRERIIIGKDKAAAFKRWLDR